MKKLIFIIAFLLLLLIGLPFPSFAEGEGNMDGGGGDMGGGTGTNVWYAGDDGVRVTVINANTFVDAKPSIDLTNRTPNDIDIHFSKTSKVSYSNGTGLAPQIATKYTYIKPIQPLPQIVSAGGGTNIEAVRSYFTDEQIIRRIAADTGMNFDTLINGHYKLLIEPIAYFTYDGVKYAATAHEAALYDQIVSGALRSAMGNLTHKNLPLAIFLEKGDLGFPAWTGSSSDFVANSQILSSLGVGVVRFTELTDEDSDGSGNNPGGSGSMPDYEYHTDIDVITAFEVYGGGSGVSPDDGGHVTFTVNGKTQTQSYVAPPNESQLVWFEWHTPKTPQDLTVTVSVTGGGRVDKATSTARISELKENTPPDPKGRDRNDGFVKVTPPTRNDRTSATWGVWIPRWHEYWVWHPDLVYEDGSHSDDCPEECTDSHGRWKDNGEYVDEGWWEYDWRAYNATISSTILTMPDDIVPTDYVGSGGRIWMKSGYGINVDARYRTGGTNGGNVTGAQNALAYFPEFDYKTYDRVLERLYDSGEYYFAFKENIFSQALLHAHYVPVWFPDDTVYEVQVELIDCWTPAGELRITKSDGSVWIDGAVFHDWRWVGH